MDAAREQIIADFLKANPQFCKAEWDEEEKDLTVFFADNPTEPCCVHEFLRTTPTWSLLTKLINDLTIG